MLKLVFLKGVLFLSFIVSTNAYGNVIVYDFFASWCGPCRTDVTRNNELQAEYEGRVEFIGINEDEEAHDADVFIESTRPNFEIKRDPTHELASSMGATNSTPSIVIEGGKGNKEVINGSLSKSALKSKIDARL